MVLVILTLAINKAEHWRVGAFELRYWGRLLRVPWTARRSNQSVLKEINNGYSLEGLMLKLKLQYFGYLMWRANSLEKILMLGKIEGRRRGWQKMRWSHSITYSMDMDLSELQARLLEWVAFLFSRGILPTQGSNPGLLHCRQILYQLNYKGSPYGRKWRTKEPLDESEKREWKRWLKTQHSEN